MKKATTLATLGFALALGSASAHAVPALFDWGFNIDGTTSCNLGPCDADGLTPGTLPPAIDATAFDFGSGLGTITITIGGAGAHNVGVFLDHEIDEPINTFFNEFGNTGGVPAAGQSWEIDEPGFFFGDLFDNFAANTLDNTNGVPGGAEDDVAMGMAFDFVLAGAQLGIVNFFTSSTNDAPGFFLQHIDAQTEESIFFWADLTIIGVPEPTSLALVLGGLLGLGWSARRKSSRA